MNVPGGAEEKSTFPRCHRLEAVLFGRHHEQAVIRSCLTKAARTGASSTLVIAGEPGVGKSALLTDSRNAAYGTVLATTGVQSEREIAYVHLAEAFRSHYSYLATIPERQAAALASVFAIGPSRPADRFTVSAATLNLMAAIATDGPLLVTVDDAHWLDSASLEAFMFAANRLEAEGVVLIFAVRAGDAVVHELSRLPTVELHGLDSDAARALLAGSAMPALSEASTARLLEESGGNPLALLTLPTTMTAEDLALWALSAEPLPINAMLEDAFSGSVGMLPARTKQALLLIAVLGSGAGIHHSALLQAEGLTVDDLEPAEDATLVSLRHGRPEFRHPLVRAAAYQAGSPGDRRRAHLRLAELLGHAVSPASLERRAWHLVAGGAAADEDFAHTIAAAAERELTAENFTVAGRLFERSSELGAPGSTAMRRMLQAAHALRLAGAIDECGALLRQAMLLGDAPELLMPIGYALHRLEVWRGAMVAGRDGLVRVGNGAAKVQPGLAAEILSDAALASLVIGDLEQARMITEQANRLAAPEGS